jgi:hypothetical protein
MVNTFANLATNTDQRLVYAVRRVSGRIGHFQDEAVWQDSADPRVDSSAATLWRPVGSLACDLVNEFIPLARRRGSTLSKADRAVLWLAEYSRRIVQGFWRVREGRELLPKRFRSQMATFGQLIHATRPRLPVFTHQRNKPSTLTVSYDLPQKGWEATALAWSTLFGLSSNRLKACANCNRLFLVSPQTKRLRRCDACRGQQVGVTVTRPRAMGFSDRQQRAYSLLRKRLDQRVYRGKMQSVDRDSQLAQALQDMKEVKAGKFSLPEWHQKWLEETRQPRGRRSGRFLHSKQGKV